MVTLEPSMCWWALAVTPSLVPAASAKAVTFPWMNTLPSAEATI